MTSAKSRVAANLFNVVMKPRSCLIAVELFALSNLAFLALDVYIAHSTNSFALSAEWIPVLFSSISPLVLIFAIWQQQSIAPSLASSPSTPRATLARWLGLLMGGAAILVGVAGLLWHLNSQFFVNATLESLVYTAPFVAPLAYTGVGLLIVLNRMVPPDSKDWGSWVLLLALGGFIGNFVLSVADHAQNGFFEWREWIPVAASALAVGSLCSIIFVDRTTPSLKAGALVMLGQIVVGLLGWYYHFCGIRNSNMDSLWDKVVYGAPVFAPLLFANLALLALIGLWSLVIAETSLHAIPNSLTRELPAHSD